MSLCICRSGGQVVQYQIWWNSRRLHRLQTPIWSYQKIIWTASKENSDFKHAQILQIQIILWIRKVIITKTCLYNFEPLKPHINIVKLGFTVVYIKLFCLFLPKDKDSGYSLESHWRGGSNEYPQSMFWAEIWKISEFFYLKTFGF